MITLEFNALTLITYSMPFREVINAALFVLFANLTALICYYMVRTWIAVPYSVWRHTDGMETACVLAWVFGIISVRSGLVWYALKLANDGRIFSETMEIVSSLTLIISAIILCIAALRATYLWTPISWHNKAWIVSVGLTALFIAISAYL